MAYQPKPMPFDPKSIAGISEKVLVSHYENNYVGAVKRLNAIGTQLAELDFAKAPNFVINGLKREELVASNSMILHEIYFDGLGGAGKPSTPLADAIARDFGSMERWRAEFSAIWSFLFDPTIDATNWRAEQAIRPAVVTRKVWGGNRTWHGADAQQTLTSVIRTAQQRHLNPQALLASMLQARDPTVPLELQSTATH